MLKTDTNKTNKIYTTKTISFPETLNNYTFRITCRENNNFSVLRVECLCIER